MFSTAADNQTAVDINVLQGERKFARDNKSLGQFRLDGIPPAMRGVPQIEVTFDIDANGIVNVSAKDLGTGKEQHITITAGSNMSDEDIERAVKEAAQFEKALKEVGDKIDAGAKANVEAEIADLKAVLERTKDQTDISDADIDALKSGKEKLMNDSQALFTQMYQNMQGGAQGAGPDMGGQSTNNGGNDDDVVDGDYREV